MALTENIASEQEISEAIANNPAFVDVLKAALPKANYAFRAKADDDALEATIIGNHTKKIAGKVETFLETEAGIKKAKDDEKWYELNQRAIKTLKTERDEKIAELEALRKNSNITEAERQQLNELLESSKNDKKAIADMKKAHLEEITRVKAGTQILSEVNPIRETFIKDDKLKKAIEIVHNQTINELLETVQINEHTGKPIFFGKDGKALLNDDKSFKSAADIYAEKMADFIDSGKVVKGAGGSGETNIKGVPAGVTTQLELSEFLQKSGLVAGTPAYTAEWNKYADKLPRR